MLLLSDAERTKLAMLLTLLIRKSTVTKSNVSERVFVPGSIKFVNAFRVQHNKTERLWYIHEGRIIHVGSKHGAYAQLHDADWGSIRGMLEDAHKTEAARMQQKSVDQFVEAITECLKD
jgi:hypothetical protein